MKNKHFEKTVQYNIKDKDQAMKHFTREILSKTTQIFEYRNLPEDLEGLEYLLETFLQKNGNVFFHKVKDKLYFFTGGLGGEYDAYYRPTLYTIANPYINYSTQAKIGEDGVLMRNDSFAEGLLPIIEKYGAMMIESNISIINAIINTRDYNAFSAQDDRTRASAELYQQKIEAGDTSVIAESAALEGLKRHPAQIHSGAMTELKELRQYIKAQLFSDLGMKTAHNMKSQYVSDAENIINDDTLLPLVQDMLKQRKIAIEELNKLYDLEVEVELSGTWKLQQEKVEIELDMIENGELIDGDDLYDTEDTPPEGQEGPSEDEEPETEETLPEQEEEPQEALNEPEEEEADIDIDIIVNSEVQDPMTVIDEGIAKLEEEDNEKAKRSD